MVWLSELSLLAARSTLSGRGAALVGKGCCVVAAQAPGPRMHATLASSSPWDAEYRINNIVVTKLQALLVGGIGAFTLGVAAYSHAWESAAAAAPATSSAGGAGSASSISGGDLLHNSSDAYDHVSSNNSNVIGSSSSSSSSSSVSGGAACSCAARVPVGRWTAVDHHGGPFDGERQLAGRASLLFFGSATLSPARAAEQMGRAAAALHEAERMRRELGAPPSPGPAAAPPSSFPFGNDRAPALSAAQPPQPAAAQQEQEQEQHQEHKHQDQQLPPALPLRCVFVSLAPGHDAPGALRSFLDRWLPREEARGEAVALTGGGVLQLVGAVKRFRSDAGGSAACDDIEDHLYGVADGELVALFGPRASAQDMGAWLLAAGARQKAMAAAGTQQGQIGGTGQRQQHQGWCSACDNDPGCAAVCVFIV